MDTNRKPLTLWRFLGWTLFTPIALLLHWNRLSRAKRIIALVWSVVLIVRIGPAIYQHDESIEQAQSTVAVKEQSSASAAETAAQVKQPDNGVWTASTYVKNLKNAGILGNTGVFVDEKMGNRLDPTEDPTNLEDAMTLTLTVETDGLDKDLLTDVAYRIAKRIYEQKRDFTLSDVYISLLDKNGDNYGDSSNFVLGINTISGYFKQSDIEHNPQTFFNWIEEHFTLPEDENLLNENQSWTLLSEKSRP